MAELRGAADESAAAAERAEGALRAADLERQQAEQCALRSISSHAQHFDLLPLAIFLLQRSDSRLSSTAADASTLSSHMPLH